MVAKKTAFIFSLDSYHMQPGNEVSISDKIVSITSTLQHQPPEKIREQLISFITTLINTDFQALVQLLYRIDVDEKKLKKLLQNNAGTDAATLIADLVISRQLQKIAVKEQFSNREKPGTDNSW